MANIKIIELKAQRVAEVAEKIKSAQSVVIFDYRGLTVEEDTNLRNEMRKAGVEYLVIKNSIVERAAQAAGIDEAINEMLKGPSAFAFGYEDPVAPAKVLKENVKKLKKCTIKGGVINGSVSNAKAIDTLAELPPKEVMLSRMLGSLMSPISGLARALNALAEKLGGGAAAQEPEAAAE
ncbi:MAG: 50S ribosomal protein L10 [Candidatus Gastranaerophilaceae bacterium]|nr:50S ribosomal protein L10 [Christensenellales bacterium]